MEVSNWIPKGYYLRVEVKHFPKSDSLPEFWAVDIYFEAGNKITLYFWDESQLIKFKNELIWGVENLKRR